MSGKKRAKVAKTGAVWHLTSEQATLAAKPRYNAHICKTGAHGDLKYNRARERRMWKREFYEGGACESGLPRFYCAKRLSLKDTPGDRSRPVPPESERMRRRASGGRSSCKRDQTANIAVDR